MDHDDIVYVDNYGCFMVYLAIADGTPQSSRCDRIIMANHHHLPHKIDGDPHKTLNVAGGVLKSHGPWHIAHDQLPWIHER